MRHPPEPKSETWPPIRLPSSEKVKPNMVLNPNNVNNIDPIKAMEYQAFLYIIQKMLCYLHFAN